MSWHDEWTLIGELIARPELLPEAQALVRADDFTCDGSRAAFEWLPKLRTNGDHAGRMRDFTTWIGRAKIRFAGDTGDAYRAIGAVVGSGAHVPFYARKIANEATWHRVERIASELANEIAGRDMDALDDAQGALERMSAAVARLQADSAIGGPRAIGEVLPEALREIEARLSGQATIGLATGFSGLDHILAGLRKQQLILVAARPSVGKSALAGNIAARVCAKGGAVLFCSLEMSALEIGERMLSSESVVSLGRMAAGKINSEDRADVIGASGAMHDWRLHVDDRADLRVADIVAQARRLKMRGGLDLVIVDYLQLIRPATGNRESRQEQVASISRSLKMAAKSLDLPIVCIAQLNRQADQPNEIPRLSHLRESGSLEQDADVVMFVHREKQQEQQDGEPVPAQLIIAKQRNGPTGKLDMEWHPQIVTFREREPKPYDFSMRTEPVEFEHDEYGVERFA